MKTKILIILLLATITQASFAGPFTDKLSICLVNNTSPADKDTLVQWIYAAMSSHPKVKSMSNISVREGNALNKKTADLFVTLLTKRCKKETKSAIEYEGSIAFKTSFGVLGQVAMKGLIKDPQVKKYISGLDNYIEPNQLKKELGVK